MKKITTLLLLIPVLSLSQVRIYPLDANAIDIISGQNGTLGTAANAPTDTTDRFGNINSAYYFDGDDYISIPTTGLTTPEFSVSAWITVSVLPTYLQDFYGIGNSMDQAFGVGDDINGIGFFQAGYTIGGPCCPRAYHDTMPQVDQWYQYVVTRSSSVLKLYVNGMLVDTTDTQGYPPDYNVSPTATIGARAPLFQSWLGKIDDVRLYDYALTDSQVVALSIPDINRDNSYFTLFPNPTASNFTLQLNSEIKNAELEIYNILGEKIYEQTINHQSTNINLQSPSGIYIVKINDRGKKFNQKLIIQ